MNTNVINQQASQIVVQDYFNLVRAIAGKIKRRLPVHVDVEDLVQTGMLGLLEASNRYDASRETDFHTYAYSRIQGAILDELRSNDTCSRRDRRTAREAEKVRAQLTNARGEEPSREELAEAIGLGVAEYEEALVRLEAGRQATLPDADNDPEQANDMSLIPSNDESPFDAYSRKQDAEMLRSYIKQLPPRQREVMSLYYFEKKSLKEIGQQLGVGESRVCQIQKEAVQSLQTVAAQSRRKPAARVSTMVQ